MFSKNDSATDPRATNENENSQRTSYESRQRQLRASAAYGATAGTSLKFFIVLALEELLHPHGHARRLNEVMLMMRWGISVEQARRVHQSPSSPSTCTAFNMRRKGLQFISRDFYGTTLFFFTTSFPCSSLSSISWRTYHAFSSCPGHATIIPGGKRVENLLRLSSTKEPPGQDSPSMPTSITQSCGSVIIPTFPVRCSSLESYLPRLYRPTRKRFWGITS